jgi:hypothetical protein
MRLPSEASCGFGRTTMGCSCAAAERESRSDVGHTMGPAFYGAAGEEYNAAPTIAIDSATSTVFLRFIPFS